MIRNQADQRVKRIMKTENVNEEDYEVYGPLRAGLNPHSETAAIHSVIFLVRRLMLVCTIFLLEDQYY